MARPTKSPAPAQERLLDELRRSGKAFDAYRLLAGAERFAIRNSPAAYRRRDGDG